MSRRRVAVLTGVYRAPSRISEMWQRFGIDLELGLLVGARETLRLFGARMCGGTINCMWGAVVAQALQRARAGDHFGKQGVALRA